MDWDGCPRACEFVSNIVCAIVSWPSVVVLLIRAIEDDCSLTKVAFFLEDDQHFRLSGTSGSHGCSVMSFCHILRVNSGCDGISELVIFSWWFVSSLFVQVA